MTTLQPPADALRRTRPSSGILTALARPGLVAHGVLYVTIGLLVLQVASNGRHEDTDGRGALQALARQPYGTWLLLVTVVGLVLLALWRAAQAVWGDPVVGTEAKHRASAAGKAAIYASLAASGTKILLHAGGSGGGSDERAKTWTAKAMELPGGRVLVALAGVAIAGYAAKAIWSRVLRAKFMEQVDRSELSASAARWIERIGRVGYAARAVVFVLVGAFVVRAAVLYDPQEAKGLSQSLQEVATSSLRPLLWLVAAGLAAFGVLSLALARYRKVE